MRINSKSFYAYFALVISMMLGFTGTSAASTCSTADVTIGGFEATSCGWGTDNNDQTFDDTSLWTVNVDYAGGVNSWSIYEREEGAVDGGVPIANAHDGNTDLINLVADNDGEGGFLGDESTSGNMTLNVFNPTLITLKDGTDTTYHWYYFAGITGEGLTGTWDAEVALDGNGLSGITAYATVVPVPAAVWLFGSGLIGLVGLARRKKS